MDGDDDERFKGMSPTARTQAKGHSKPHTLDPDTGEPLPKDWRFRLDPTRGRVYYYHKRTKQVQWNKPSLSQAGNLLSMEAVGNTWAPMPEEDGK